MLVEIKGYAKQPLKEGQYQGVVALGVADNPDNATISGLDNVVAKPSSILFVKTETFKHGIPIANQQSWLTWLGGIGGNLGVAGVHGAVKKEDCHIPSVLVDACGARVATAGSFDNISRQMGHSPRGNSPGFEFAFLDELFSVMFGTSNVDNATVGFTVDTVGRS